MNANDVQNSITLAVNHIAKNASQLNKQNENDYYENGLLMVNAIRRSNAEVSCLALNEL